MDQSSEFAKAATGGVRRLLRAEGLALLAAAAAVYAHTGASWTLFAFLFLAPDLSFAFYLGGKSLGALAYNAAHSTVGPIALAAAAQLAPAHMRMLLPIALIWFAHFGFDRALGYGLKYSSAFGDTHLGRIGHKRSQTT